MTRIKGRPARHTKMLRNRSVGYRVFGWLTILLAVVPIIVLTGVGANGAVLETISAAANQNSAVRLAFGVMAVSLLAVGGTVEVSQRKRYRQLRAGIRSEKKALAQLKRCGLYAIVNGADLGAGGDADHVAIGPQLVAVETKTGYGRAEIKGGQLKVRGRKLPGDPVAQATRQARALGRKAGQTAYPILCVVDMDGPPQTYGELILCAARDLPLAIGMLPRHLSQADAKAIFNSLKLA